MRYLPVLLATFIVISCAPRPSYNDHVQPRAAASGEKINTRVSAAVEQWRNSGVMVKKGETYSITAEGRWRTYGTCNFTGPDGIGLYNTFCFISPLSPSVIPGYSHSMLLAKIGEKGTPFPVGSRYELTAPSDGVLYFRINDTVNAVSDNEGYADVVIDPLSNGSVASSQTAKPLAVTPAAQSTPPSLADKPLSLVAHSGQQTRIALVIGNSDYAFGPLKNPVNDAQAMGNALKALGFTVILKLNAGQQAMEEAVDEFSRKLGGGNQVALFYYAGHGVQLGADNYLIPTDISISRQSDVRYKAANVGQILAAMGEAGDNLNIVILDACRDNPLPRSFRSAARGLARVEGPKGTVIGFATSPGSVALDGEGDNGVYTKHLLENIQKPGLSIEQVFKEVLRGVNEETDGKQTPWTESSFTGTFSFTVN
jgi:hypothetical protein